MRPVRAPTVSTAISRPHAFGTGVPAHAASHKRCPWCDNLAEKLVSLCRACGFKFDRPEFMKKCPSCSDVIFAFSVLCPTCRFDVHSYYDKLSRRAKHMEEEIVHVVHDRIAPELREVEERVEDAAHRVARRIHLRSPTHFLIRGAPPGTRCFRCGSGVKVGTTRCMHCKVRVVLG